MNISQFKQNPLLSFENMEASASALQKPFGKNYLDGIPVMKVKDVFDEINNYKKLVLVTLFANIMLMATVIILL